MSKPSSTLRSTDSEKSKSYVYDFTDIEEKLDEIAKKPMLEQKKLLSVLQQLRGLLDVINEISLPNAVPCAHSVSAHSVSAHSVSAEITTENAMTVSTPKVNEREHPTIKSDYNLYDYQEEAIEWMVKKEANEIDGIRGGMLCLVMGLGKTLTMLEHVRRQRIANKETMPTLIIMSKTLLYEWKNQGITKFYDNYRVLYYHPEFLGKTNYKKINTKALLDNDIVFTTYDVCMNIYREHDYEDTITLKGDDGIFLNKIIFTLNRNRPVLSDHEGPKALYEMPWERVICDESQRFANPSTRTFRAMMAVYGKHKWCLSGTPIRNYKTDIWAQLRWCGFSRIVHARDWKDECWNMYNCKQHVYTLNYADASVKMPPLIDKVYNIIMEQNQAVLYETTKKYLSNMFAEFLANRKISYACILALFTRLRQICIAPYILVSNKDEKLMDELRKKDIEVKTTFTKKGNGGIKSPKIAKVVEIAKSCDKNKEKVIVFSMFVSGLNLTRHALEEEKVNCVIITGSTNIPDRLKAMELFKNSSQCNVLLVHYKVGGEGLNLIEATHVIPLEPWWTNAVHNQGIHRAWRRGQTKPVTVHWLLTQNTIEGKILALCKTKDKIVDNYIGGIAKISSRETKSIDMWTMQNLLA
jgi:SNF2 family DNA or RNA helicase